MSHEDAVVNLPKNLKLSHIPKIQNSQLLKIQKKKFTECNFILKLRILIMENNYLKIFFSQYVKLKKIGT